MREVHGSMMDATGATPEDLPRAQAHLVAASLPDPAHPKRAPLPLPLVPVARGFALQSLVKQVATSQSAQAMQIGMALPGLAFDAGAAPQGLAFADAVVKQCMTLQAQWIDGLTELAEEMGQMREANTVSKYVDQEMNLVQQGLGLMSNQLTATARLMENIQFSAVWWLTQRAQGSGR